jgi:MFS family permease
MIVFCSFIAIGQSVFAMGMSAKSWGLMYTGRVVFGFGGESLAVANSSILADWFDGGELAFAFGLNLSIARLGSVINNLVSPSLANNVSLVFALWFSAILCGASVGCALILYPIDARMDAQLKKSSPKLKIGNDENTIVSPLLEDDYSGHDINSTRGSSGPSMDSKKTGSEAAPEEVSFYEVKKFTFALWLLVISCVVVYGCVLPFNNIASSLLLERDYFMDPGDECQLEDPTQCQSDTNRPNSFCPSSTDYAPPLPTQGTDGDGNFYPELESSDIDCTDDAWSDDGVCTYEYCKRQNDATVKATTTMSIPYIISAIMSPVLGKLVDAIGRRAVIATCAPILLIIVHSMLGFSDITPEVPMAGQGLAYSGFAAVLWPSVPLVVEKRLVGLAYGVITSIQNIGLASFPLIVAAIYSDNGEQYIPNVEVFFISLAVLGTLVGFYLNYFDAHNDNIFNRITPKEGDDSEEDEILKGEDGEPYRKLSVGSFTANEAQYAAKIRQSSTSKN